MTSINFKASGLTRPGFEPTGSGHEPARLGFPGLPAGEAGVLLIWSPRQVQNYMEGGLVIVTQFQGRLLMVIDWSLVPICWRPVADWLAFC